MDNNSAWIGFAIGVVYAVVFLYIGQVANAYYEKRKKLKKQQRDPLYACYSPLPLQEELRTISKWMKPDQSLLLKTGRFVATMENGLFAETIQGKKMLVDEKNFPLLSQYVTCEELHGLITKDKYETSLIHYRWDKRCSVKNEDAQCLNGSKK